MISGKSSGTLLGLLGIEKPIIQAAMAGVSTPSLAAAVSNAGGLGSLGVVQWMLWAPVRLSTRRALIAKPFNVNVFCHSPATADEWLDWITPLFKSCDAVPAASLSEIFTSFAEDAAMLEMFLEERPAVVSFHFGLPSPEVIGSLKKAGIKLLATATNRQFKLVFPVAARGTNEGNFAYDFGPQSTMTNASVDTVVTGTSGRDLKLSYKGGML